MKECMLPLKGHERFSGAYLAVPEGMPAPHEGMPAAPAVMLASNERILASPEGP